MWPKLNPMRAFSCRNFPAKHRRHFPGSGISSPVAFAAGTPHDDVNIPPTPGCIPWAYQIPPSISGERRAQEATSGVKGE